MEFRQIVFSSFIGMNCIYCTAVRIYSTSISCFFPLCFLFIFQDIWLKRINENDLWNSEINWAVNVSFSSHNFLEDVFLIRHSLSIYNILSANKFLLVSHIINVQCAHVSRHVYTHYKCTCRPDRTVFKNVHFDWRVFNTVRKRCVSNLVQQMSFFNTYLSQEAEFYFLD